MTGFLQRLVRRGRGGADLAALPLLRALRPIYAGGLRTGDPGWTGVEAIGEEPVISRSTALNPASEVSDVDGPPSAAPAQPESPARVQASHPPLALSSAVTPAQTATAAPQRARLGAERPADLTHPARASPDPPVRSSSPDHPSKTSPIPTRSASAPRGREAQEPAHRTVREPRNEAGIQDALSRLNPPSPHSEAEFSPEPVVSIGRIEIEVVPPRAPEPRAEPPRTRGFVAYDRVRRGLDR